MNYLYKLLMGHGFRLVAEERFKAGMEIAWVNPEFPGFHGRSAEDVAACAQRVAKHSTRPLA